MKDMKDIAWYSITFQSKRGFFTDQDQIYWKIQLIYKATKCNKNSG